MLKKKINEIILYFSKFFLVLFVKLNSPLFSSIILLINLRKVKKIYTSKDVKKIIILSKSNGYEDILSAYQKNKTNNVNAFYSLPRVLIKKIFYNFLKNEKCYDYYTIDFDENIKQKKKDYKLFIKKVFLILNRFWKFDAIIGFNPFYHAEHDLPEPIKEIGKKFLTIHKESLSTDKENVDDFKIYKEQNKKYLANKVAVYNEYEKNKLVDSNFLNINQVEVTGCARSSNCFEIRNTKPTDNKIVYFMIYEEGQKFIKWTNLANSTMNYLHHYALKNPSANIIFKGKTGVHSKNNLPKELPSNCSFELEHDAHKLLTSAKVVVCFNSTILFEAIIANREIIIPNFGIDRSKLKDFIYKTPDYFADSKEIFFKMIDEKLKKPYVSKKFSKEEVYCINFYLGNADGKAGYRLKNFIDKNI